MQSSLSSGERGYDSNRWQQGRCRADGNGRCLEGTARSSQSREHPRDRAYVRSTGNRFQSAPSPRERRAHRPRARSRHRAAPRDRPRPQRGHRRPHGRCVRGQVRRHRIPHMTDLRVPYDSPAFEASARERGPVRAPHGTTISCKGWQQEAALRMLMNNLDPEVAERPADLVVYGGTGKAARNWDSFDAIVRELTVLGNDETLLVQSGKPVGVFRTHSGAPRVLIANSNLVGRWATWEHFRELERKGLMMYGQMTAGSWIYIGSQGIVQGTHETLGSVAQKHFGGSLRGRFVLTAGLGGMGGAQPLAATMQGAAALVIEVDESRIDKRLETRYLDRKTASVDEALSLISAATRDGESLSVGLLGNAADILPTLVERGVTPDVLTDQTSAHDMLNGYVPSGMTLEDAVALR